MKATLFLAIGGLASALAGCTFDSSQLRALSPDGATGYGGASAGAGGIGGQAGAGRTGGQGATSTAPAACVPGASAECYCPTGQQGAQACTSAGTFEACVCATPTVDAGGAGGSDGAAASSPDAPTATGGTTVMTTCTPIPQSTGGLSCPNGKCMVGAYSGSAFTYTDGTSTICMSANSLCAAGTSNTLSSTDTTTNWGIVFGFYLSPTSTATNLVGVQLAGLGISVKLSSLPTGAQARVQVTVGASNYCATMSTASQTLPWTSFNTACWNNTGTYLTGAPTAATLIAITVNSEPGVAGSFDICVTSLSFPGSETCPTGDHDDGTGNCVVNGTCATGYHSGGTGTCVVSGTCVSGYHSGGTGTCVVSGTCSTGYHDGGTGTCVVSGTCATGYHDGGGGTCVASGTCSAGYNNCSGTCSASSCSGGGGTGSCSPCPEGYCCH